MAYPRPAYDSRSPHDSERPRPSWDPLQRPHYSSMPSPSHHSMASPGYLDPESESSDVSDDPGDDYRTRGHPIYPIAIPPAPAKHSLESLDTIETRLRDLQRVEDHNIRKQEHLKAKRARKDERIRRKREAQDAKIKLIMDTRARRDDRISRRRKVEDEAFERFDQDLEDEENNLRRRQKRLKRGLPVEDTAMGSRISSVSMSPPGPAYSNVPPPPKRHQTGPPGQNNSPATSNPRPIPQSTPLVPTSTGPNPPPYAFLQSSHPPTSSAYGHSPTISHSPSGNPGTFQPTHRPHQQKGQPSPYTLNGHPPSPQTSRPPPANTNPILNTAPPPPAPPPRQPTTYDTRPPPPPASSGFATINTPSSSGFAAINPRNTATPPAPANVPLAKSADHDRSNGYTRPYTTEGTPTGSSAVAGSKRTPSTTHPYQMSEAFANRHHHCERTDHLNRGIWTSFGPVGTKEMPTGPPLEMYLRCNHDGCRRIDWKTVHGLQCHIVKNHEQPKGTIGSLEKALDRYGVPVAEVEAYEREHGDGTGGTMADPKNFKLKMKPGHITEKPDGQRRSLGPQPSPTAPRPNMPIPLGSSVQPYQGSPTLARSQPHEDTEGSETEPRKPPVGLVAKSSQSSQPPQFPQPPSRFAAVNGVWSTVPDSKLAETKDVVMKDAPASPHSPSASNVPKRDATFWKMWPEVPGSSKTENPGHLSGPSLAPSPMRAGPPSTSNQQFSGNAVNAHPASSAPPTPTPAVQAPKALSTPSHVVHNQMRTSPQEHTEEARPPSAISTQPIAQEQPAMRSGEVKKPSEVTKHANQEVLSPQVSTPTPRQEVTEVKDTPKEPEKPKPETVDSGRVEPKSPAGITRRASLIGGRRESSRRSSVAAIRAEKEQDKRDEALLAATTPFKVTAGTAKDTKKTPEQQVKEANLDSAEVEQGKGSERDGNQSKDEDSDDPDTIKVPSVTSKDNDNDRDKDGKENKTTPRRMANGRFTRKMQYR